MAKPANSRIVQYILLCLGFRTRYFILALVFVVNACAIEGDALTQASDTQRLEGKHNVDQAIPIKPSSQVSKNEFGKAIPKRIDIEKEVILYDGNDQTAIPEQATTPEIDYANFKKKLLGLDADEVVRRLGAPVFRRYEPPAEIWQYRTSACVVDVFLYESKGNFGVEYVETRGRVRQEVDENTCFNSVLNKFLTNSRSGKTVQYTRRAHFN